MKAKKVETYRDKYFTTVVYEYKKHTYEVQYANSWLCCCSPAWIQHRDAQEKIDKILEQEKKAIEEDYDFNKELDEIWEALGW